MQWNVDIKESLLLLPSSYVNIFSSLCSQVLPVCLFFIIRDQFSYSYKTIVPFVLKVTFLGVRLEDKNDSELSGTKPSLLIFFHEYSFELLLSFSIIWTLLLYGIY